MRPISKNFENGDYMKILYTMRYGIRDALNEL